MNRLDALEARVENMRNRFFTDAPQTFMSIDLRDIERLVAAVKAAQILLQTWEGQTRETFVSSQATFREWDAMKNTLAYWLEEQG